LERYDLRAQLHARDDFHFLLESESLATRLKRELESAAEDLVRNPRDFLRGLLRGEGSTRQRRKLLQAGLASAVIVYSMIAMATLIGGILRNANSNPVTAAAPMPEPSPFVIPILTEEPQHPKIEVKSSRGLLGGSLKQPQPQRSAGGGGHDEDLAASRGRMPTPSFSPQINLPDFSPPKIKIATLIVPETVFADDAFRQKIDGRIGVREGQVIAPSRGDRNGTGVGQGTGPGFDKGDGGNFGNDKFRRGAGAVNGIGDEAVRPMSAHVKPTILHREKAKYTEEARQNRIQGTVVLSVVLGADRQIHDIRTVHGLPHGLTETAIEAARRIRFNPAILNGRTVSVRATLEFNFALY
jgi:TonB family protein